MRQPVLPLLPADATPIGPAAGLVDSPDGGTVFVFGQATFAFAPDDEVGRLAAGTALAAARDRLTVAADTSRATHHVDGHVRVYAGTRNLPKTHIARGVVRAQHPGEGGLGVVGGDPDGVGEQLAFLVEQPGVRADLVQGQVAGTRPSSTSHRRLARDHDATLKISTPARPRRPRPNPPGGAFSITSQPQPA